MDLVLLVASGIGFSVQSYRLRKLPKLLETFILISFDKSLVSCEGWIHFMHQLGPALRVVRSCLHLALGFSALLL